MVRAWYMNDVKGDPRLEHQKEPPHPIDLTTLTKVTGVLCFQLNTESLRQELDQIKSERGYSFEDEVEIVKEKLPEDMWKIFNEHVHPEEEIRYVSEGSGYLDVRDFLDDSWIRINITPGDLIIIPSGIYHRFILDTNNYIKAKRLFVGQPVWTAYPRPADEISCRKLYLEFMKNSLTKNS